MTTRRAAAVLILLIAWLGARCVGDPGPTAEEYREEIARHRADREDRLRAEEGWLSLVGLFWLEPGENRFGSDPEHPIRLPTDAAPVLAGTFTVDGSTVHMRSAPGVEITFDGSPVTEWEHVAGSGDSAPLRLGRLRLHVIERGDRFAIRAKDPESPTRRDFHGLEFFPVDERYRVEARFLPYDAPREVTISTVVGTSFVQQVPGRVEFTLDGSTYTLEPIVDDPSDSEWWFIFKDATSGDETYGAGRYLYADRVAADRIDLDFNRAYNPPCAFTAFATCPLPPPGNRLAARIEAGERSH